MSTAQFNTWKNTAGTREFAPCTAWVRIHSDGSPYVVDSMNVASLVDVGTGQVGINFTVAMDNPNYAIAAVAQRNATNSALFCCPTRANAGTLPTITGFNLTVSITNGSVEDPDEISATTFGGVA